MIYLNNIGVLTMNKPKKQVKPSKTHPWRTYKKILNRDDLEDVPVITINSYSYGR